MSNGHFTTQDGPKVLQDVSFTIKAGERVGVGKELARISPYNSMFMTFDSWTYGVRKVNTHASSPSLHLHGRDCHL